MARMERTIVIGDVHGCASELEALLRACAWRPSDRVVLVGDLVNKGPESARTIEIAADGKFLGVRGNHDEAVLNWRRALDAGRELPRLSKMGIRTAETLQAAHLDYLESLPYSLDLGEGFVVVHAGFVPGVALADQTVQSMIRLRSIAADGEPTDKVEGTPWAKQWSGPEFVIFGHDAVRGFQSESFAMGLDTGCCYGNELTALILPEKRIVSVPARRVYSEPSA